MELVINPLTSTGHTRSSIKRVPFNCGDKHYHEALDNYLKRLAWKNHEDGIAKTFIASPRENTREVLGYYSSSMSLIDFQSIPEKFQDALPGYPVPAMLIGRLAVDKSAQKQGVGKRLLRHAYETLDDVFHKVGVYAIRVDAKDEDAKRYYVEKRGFQELTEMHLGVFLLASTVREAVAIYRSKLD